MTQSTPAKADLPRSPSGLSRMGAGASVHQSPHADAALAQFTALQQALAGQPPAASPAAGASGRRRRLTRVNSLPLLRQSSWTDELDVDEEPNPRQQAQHPVAIQPLAFEQQPPLDVRRGRIRRASAGPSAYSAYVSPFATPSSSFQPMTDEVGAPGEAQAPASAFRVVDGSPDAMIPGMVIRGALVASNRCPAQAKSPRAGHYRSDEPRYGGMVESLFEHQACDAGPSTAHQQMERHGSLAPWPSALTGTSSLLAASPMGERSVQLSSSSLVCDGTASNSNSGNLFRVPEESTVEPGAESYLMQVCAPVLSCYRRTDDSQRPPAVSSQGATWRAPPPPPFGSSASGVSPRQSADYALSSPFAAAGLGFPSPASCSDADKKPPSPFALASGAGTCQEEAPDASDAAQGLTGPSQALLSPFSAAMVGPPAAESIDEFSVATSPFAVQSWDVNDSDASVILQNQTPSLCTESVHDPDIGEDRSFSGNNLVACFLSSDGCAMRSSNARVSPDTAVTVDSTSDFPNSGSGPGGIIPPCSGLIRDGLGSGEEVYQCPLRNLRPATGSKLRPSDGQ